MNLSNIIEVTKFTDLGGAIRITFRTTKLSPSGPVELYKAGKVPQVYETIADIVLTPGSAEFLIAQLKESISNLVTPSPEDTLKVIK